MGNKQGKDDGNDAASDRLLPENARLLRKTEQEAEQKLRKPTERRLLILSSSYWGARRAKRCKAEPPTTVPALLERLALSQYAEAVAANGWTELQTLLELSEAPAEPPTTPPTSKLFEQAKALMKVGHARRLADMTAQLAAAVRARKQ